MPDFQETGEAIAHGHDELWTKETFDRLSKMIEYAAARQDWYEEQRNKALAIAIGLLGLSSFLAAGLLSADVAKMYLFRISALLTLISIVATALFIIFEYLKGAQERYTHRSLADIRSWYFAYVITPKVTDAAKLGHGNTAENEATLSAAWEGFLTKWIEYQKVDRRRAIEDLQQVFVLYLFQAIRQKSLRCMLAIAARGGTVIGFLLIPTLIFAAARI